MIRELFIKNYRSIVETRLHLEPLMVLIGPNNAGKTNLLRAIKQFSDAVNPSQPFKASTDGSPGGLVGSVVLGAPIANRTITRASTRLIARTDLGQIDLEIHGRSAGPSATHLRVTPKDAKGPRALNLQEVNQLVAGTRCSPIYSFEPSALRRAVPMQWARQNGTIAADGFGLSGMLFALQSDRPDLWDELQREFQEFVPGVKRINFGEQDGNVTLTYWEQGHTAATKIDEVSDGIVLLTALLAVRHLVGETAIVLLEDPERGVHPHRLHEVTSTLIELSEGTPGTKPVQIVMTSHSPYFLDRFRDSPASVVVVERSEAGGTVCIPLLDRIKDLPDRSASLGELWYSGVLGGVPREAKA